MTKALKETRLSAVRKFETSTNQPKNPFFSLIAGQTLAVIPEFELESGVVLKRVPVAYKTRGTLNESGDNVMIICHALTGSADVADWWGPLVGDGKAIDTSRFFVVCFNALGSPYGSASPVTINPTTGQYYGPEFPLTTIRDDVTIHRLVLETLGVKRVAVVIGGSMGGMQVLEWAYFGKDFVQAIVPLATSARHSAWCISWAEAQRQSIGVDPKYDNGYYQFDDPPVTGLGAARMSALLTYRSRDSFESRFGRNTPDPKRQQFINMHLNPSNPPATPQEEHWSIHNDGFKNTKRLSSGRPASHSPPQSTVEQQLDTKREEKDISPGLPPTLIQQTHHGSENCNGISTGVDNGVGNGKTSSNDDNDNSRPSNGNSSCVYPATDNLKKPSTYFSAQTYLRYQAEKFVKRFDANCYIAITRKLDTHDVSRGRAPSGDIRAALQLIEQPTLVIGIESDGLFTYEEQQELANCIPNARLATIDSPEGHDAFLLQFTDVNRHILGFLKEVFPEIMARLGEENDCIGRKAEELKPISGTVGEVDDITAW